MPVWVLTACFTTISGAEITFPCCPVNGCRDAGLGESVGSPGSPFWFLSPGLPDGPERPGDPTGPCSPFSPGGPWTQICPFLVKSLCFVVRKVLVIYFCISAARALPCPSEALGGREFRFWLKGEVESTSEKDVSVKLKLIDPLVNYHLFAILTSLSYSRCVAVLILQIDFTMFTYSVLKMDADYKGEYVACK